MAGPAHMPGPGPAKGAAPVTGGEKPGFSFLVCPDGHMLRRALDDALAACPPERGQWERHVFWGDEEPPPRFWELLSLEELFGASRAVVVRQAQLWPAAVWKKLSRAIARPSARVWPVFCLEGEWEKRRPKIPAHITRLRCFAFADGRGWVWRGEGLAERDVPRHVRERARAIGLAFEPQALEQFCASVPPDGLAIENELAKLRLMAGDAPVTSAMTAAGGWTPECNVFACIRRMESGDLAGVWRELARSEDGDRLLFSLLALLAREWRLLWQLLAGEEVRLHPSDASFKRALAQRLGAAGLARGFAALADAEWQVKSGRRSPSQSLESLAAAMTALCAPPRRA
ncbi:MULTISPECIES: DNA polymerase III subunit delta [unclassified Desulfovibrio]|uniref:DNA polymerase III subunit delta n=1 Tax=unclassified Desulfovibrio TaxID=2593640 RepID=UPI001F149A96|nr:MULTISPECIES: DNA polymerase III subunit delta [unclassified Desulfovibrio]